MEFVNILQEIVLIPMLVLQIVAWNPHLQILVFTWIILRVVFLTTINARFMAATLLLRLSQVVVPLLTYLVTMVMDAPPIVAIQLLVVNINKLCVMMVILALQIVAMMQLVNAKLHQFLVIDA